MHWTVHLGGGPRRVNHAAVVVGDQIFSFGGYCTGENYLERRPIDVHVLNTSNFRWCALPIPKQNDLEPMYTPFQRYGHTAVPFGQKIYVWGGRNDEEACNVLFCFDTNTFEWNCPEVSGTIPGARDGHSACIINNYMYIFGGYEEAPEKFSQEVHALDLCTMHWSFIETKGEPPSYRDFHSATSLGDRMYIFGGRGDMNAPFHSQNEVYCSDIMYLDTQTGKWHRPITAGDVPIGRRSHSAFVYNGDLYVFGGYNGVTNQHFNDLYRFSSERDEWKLMEPYGIPPSRRRRQSCLVVGDKVFLFGGTSPYLGPMPPGPEDHGIVVNQAPGQDAKLMDHNDLHILDFAPSLRTLSMLVVIQHHLEQMWLPEDIKMDLRAMTTHNSISRPFNNTG